MNITVKENFSERNVILNREDRMKEEKKITCKQDDLGQHICAVDSCESSTYKPYVIRYLVSFCLLSPQLSQISYVNSIIIIVSQNMHYRLQDH